MQGMSGDYAKAYRSGNPTPEQARQAWARIFDEFIEVHGLPETYEQYINKRVRALGFFDQANNGKRWQIVRAHVLEAEAEELLKGEGEKIETTCARLSRFMGFPVRADQCSAAEFYSYAALMQNA